MKEWGYGEGYQHAHKFEDAMVDMECLPPSLAGRYYFPTDRGGGEADRGAAGRGAGRARRVMP
jgi:replication-associated recombination protein RarA